MEKEISCLIDVFINLSDELRPGYAQSIAKDSESSLVLPNSLKMLYSKVSGTYYKIENQQMMDFLPGYLLIRDVEYEGFMQSIKEIIPDEEDEYYPILVNYSSDFYALKVSEGKENGIFLIEHDSDEPIKIHNSFEDFLRTIIACYQEKVYFWMMMDILIWTLMESNSSVKSIILILTTGLKIKSMIICVVKR